VFAAKPGVTTSPTGFTGFKLASVRQANLVIPTPRKQASTAFSGLAGIFLGLDANRGAISAATLRSLVKGGGRKRQDLSGQVNCAERSSRRQHYGLGDPARTRGDDPSPIAGRM
jgi:hypothetical protein